MKQSLKQQGMDFSIHIAELVKFLKGKEAGFSLCDQLLACGTKAGFCCCNMRNEQTKQDALQQVKEALFIIELAVRAGYLSERQGIPIKTECANLVTALEKGGYENETEG